MQHTEYYEMRKLYESPVHMDIPQKISTLGRRVRLA